MSVEVTEHGLKRREFLSSAVALSGIAAAASFVGPSKVWGAPPHQSLDPVNPDILFGTTSSIRSQQHDIVWAVKRIAAMGLQPCGCGHYKVNMGQHVIARPVDDLRSRRR